MFELLTHAHLDQIEPQFTVPVSMIAQGYLLISGQAGLWTEVRSGMDINRLTNVAPKSNDIQPGTMYVERVAEVLEIHSSDRGIVLDTGQAVLTGIATGLIPDYWVTKKWAEYINEMQPDAERHNLCMQYYNLFKSIHDGVKDHCHR